MNVLTSGHKYELENFENTGAPGQTVQFIEKKPASAGSPELVTVNDGTTNEDVLAMMIDRMNYLQAKHPCDENARVITHLECALLELNERTRRRKERGVEGTNAK